MYRRAGGILGLVVVALLATAVCASAASATSYSVGKPALSGAPHMNVAFTASGVTTPTSPAGVKTVVKVQVLMRNASGAYKPMLAPFTAKLVRRSGRPGYRYSKAITIPMLGKHALQALRYNNGKLVAKSPLTYINVTAASRKIAINGDSHADVGATASTPLDVVFTYAAGRPCAANIHFQAASLFARTAVGPLTMTYHTDGLAAGIYAWECSMGKMCHGGNLVVSQAVPVNGDSHADVIAPANKPIDVVFSYKAGAPCAANIHFTSGTFTKASDAPLTWHSNGLAAGSYSWECSMGPACHGGTLVVQ
jgi:hypothetical protein